MQYENPSATTPKRGWRRAKLVAGTLALTMGAFGTVAVVTALPAFADVTSNNYTIGTPSGAVNSVAVTPTSTTATISTSYTVLFTATSALSASGGDGHRDAVGSARGHAHGSGLARRPHRVVVLHIWVRRGHSRRYRDNVPITYTWPPPLAAPLRPATGSRPRSQLPPRRRALRATRSR